MKLFSDIITIMQGDREIIKITDHLGNVIWEKTNKRFTLNVESNGNGTVSGNGQYLKGTEIRISAFPDEGYEFESWQDGNIDNPRTITVSRNYTYTASFKQVI